MSKESITLTIREFLKDRPYLLLATLVVVVGIVYCLYTIFSIRPSDVTVYTRYSSFGDIHFYKDHWQYLLTFASYGAAVTVVHTILMIKFHDMGRRQTGVLIGWIGVVLLIIAFVYTSAVIGLGYAA